MMKSACGIEAVYMCFNGTGIWGGETLFVYIGLLGGHDLLFHVLCFICLIEDIIYISENSWYNMLQL